MCWITNQYPRDDVSMFVPKAQMNEMMFMEEQERIEKYAIIKDVIKKKFEVLFMENGII